LRGVDVKAARRFRVDVKVSINRNCQGNRKPKSVAEQPTAIARATASQKCREAVNQLPMP